MSEDLKKIPAQHRPFAQLLLTALAISKKIQPSLKEREQVYRRLLIYIRSIAMIMSDTTKDDFAQKYAKRIINDIETTISKTGECYDLESSINAEWDAHFDNLYRKDELKRGEKKMSDKQPLVYGTLRSISDALEDLREWLTTFKRPGEVELSDEQYEDPDRDDYYLRKTPLDLISEIENDVDYVRKHIG